MAITVQAEGGRWGGPDQAIRRERVAECPGASSTVPWMCPIRGDTASAAGPNTGTMYRFSVRYWITTRPCDSGSARGGSAMILAGGSFARGTRGAAPRTRRTLCAAAGAAPRPPTLRNPAAKGWLRPRRGRVRRAQRLPFRLRPFLCLAAGTRCPCRLFQIAVRVAP